MVEVAVVEAVAAPEAGRNVNGICYYLTDLGLTDLLCYLYNYYCILPIIGL